MYDLFNNIPVESSFHFKKKLELISQHEFDLLVWNVFILSYYIIGKISICK